MGLQSIGSQRVGHDRSDVAYMRAQMKETETASTRESLGLTVKVVLNSK